MPDNVVRDGIIFFAAQLVANCSHHDAIDFARQRSWLDRAGNATLEGRALVAALSEQNGTRTTFRNVI